MVVDLSRRTFLGAAAGSTALVLTRGIHPVAAQAGESGVFAHGVASGDPTADGAILWTRVTTAAPSVEVQWEVASDDAFADVIAAGTTTADAAADHTVHVDAGGLAPGRDHWFRFHALGATSPVGRTRTLPAPGTAVDAVRIGMVTCAEYEFGYFGAYRHLAARDDVDLVLHLGDYIYEFGVGYGSPPTVLSTPGPAIGRAHEPPTELLSLADYRTRYAQYRSDPDCQALHAAHPMIAMYDDHEVANDTWRDGAQNHQAGEGPFAERASAGRQAWREWMPIRVAAPDPEVAHRSFRIGDLAELWMLDERRYRDQQPANAFFSYGSVDPSINDPSRTMLGSEQRGWLLDGLQQTPAAWRLLGNPVPFFPIVLAPGLLAALGAALGSDVGAFPPLPPPLTVDDWNGYAAERRTIVDAITSGPLPDVLVLTGDYHETFVSEIPADIASYAVDGASAAVEFVTPAVTSPGLAETFERGGLPNGDAIDAAFEANLAANNPWVRHHEGRSHGFGVVELTADRAQFDVVYLADRLDPSAAAAVASSWEVPRGTSKVVAAAAPLAARARSTAPAAPVDDAAPTGAAAPPSVGGAGTLAATGGTDVASAAAAVALAAAIAREAIRRVAPKD